ncbi:MAG: ankyrin repeat domain-containing protein [Alphaproteobacteria bacterium]|nr:MAG: ankyrin repeat domain-containing protein [Alphaproteobacteria bacterium]
MTRAVMRRIGLAGALVGAVLATPAAAQFFSDGYEFLKAVKDRDGDTATAALNEPGTTIINARDLTSGQTALHIVIERRDLLWTNFLIQRGANPNIRDKKGVSPLQLAVGLGFVEGVEALLDAGAEIDVNDSSGETPLIAAVHRRDTALLRLLLSKGANPDRTDNSGRSARDYAELSISNRALLDEFQRADDERAGKKVEKNYGPTF